MVSGEFAVEVVPQGEDGGERLAESAGEGVHGIGDLALFLVVRPEVTEGEEVDAAGECGARALGGLKPGEEPGGKQPGAEEEGGFEKLPAGEVLGIE